MNSPSHVVASLVLLGRREQPRLLLPIALGSFLPDVPMFGLYFYERVIRAQPERWIWSTGYYQDYWQDTIDLFNSLPLMALAAAVAYALRSPWWVAFCASMAVHASADLLVHHGDSHRHFWPLSQWRFDSPVSYWDPAHHGRLFSALELSGGLVGCFWLRRHYRRTWVRHLAVVLAAAYAATILIVIFLWSGGDHAG